MGKLVIESLTRKLHLKKIAKAVYKTLGQTDNLKVELVFVSGEEMQALNNRTRGVDAMTDVLSYPTLHNQKGEIIKRENHRTESEGKFVLIGSIVLCDEKVRAQAMDLGHSEERERTYLIIHGLMHLFGYDHMNDQDKKEMREKEKQALSLLGINDQ